MSQYKLQHREGTCTFHKITHGRKWIGRVYQHADGSWRGAINKKELSNEPTAVRAFNQAVAKHLGFSDVSELDNQNQAVRSLNRQRKQYAQHAFNEMLNGNFKPLDKLLFDK